MLFNAGRRLSLQFSMRSFASQAWVEPKTIKELDTTSWENFQQTKSLDYTQMTDYRSFETDINN